MVLYRVIMSVVTLMWLFAAEQVFVHCQTDPSVELSNSTLCPPIIWESSSKHVGGSIVSHMSFGNINYTHNLSCFWKIPDQPGYEIHLIFNDFSLEAASRWTKKCSYDNLTLTWINLEGFSNNMTICGSQSPDPVKASHNVTVTFKSDNTENNFGFRISFYYTLKNVTDNSSTVQPCSTLTNIESSMILENEKTVPDGQNCTWNIPAPTNNQALLVVWENMRLSLPVDGECVLNNLTISYTKRNLGNRKKSFCGQNTLPPVLITYDAVSITFKSQSSEQDNIFRLLFSYGDFKDADLKNVVSPTTITSSSVFTSTAKLTSLASTSAMMATSESVLSISCPPITWQGLNSGLIQSHTGPGNYSPKSNCSWIIPTPQVGYYTKLHILQFEMEDSSPLTRNCDYDYLLIEVEKNVYEPRKYCGNNRPPTDVVYANDITTIQGISIYFYSDNSINGGGFKIHFEYVKAGTKCGSINSFPGGGFIDSHIRLSSSTRYESNVTCYWQIPPPSKVGKQFVLVTFSNFNIEGSSMGTCRYDNITFRYTSLNNRQVPLNATFCGKVAPAPFLSTSGVAIVFRTDATLHFDGFRLNFNYTDNPIIPNPPSPCPKIVWEAQPDPLHSPNIQRNFPNIRRGVLLSHLLSSSYRAHLSCNWSIPAQPGFRAAIYFHSFHLENANSEGRCIYDNLTITYNLKQPNYYPFLHGDPGQRQFSLVPSYQSQVLCGLQLYKPPIVSDNGIEILFQTDHSNEREGFNATIYYIPVNMTQADDSKGTAGTETPFIIPKTCEDAIQTKRSAVNALDFWNNPKLYAPGLICTWRLQTSRYDRFIRRRSVMRIFVEAIDIPCMDDGGEPFDKLVISSLNRINDFGTYSREFCGSNNVTRLNQQRIFITDGRAMVKFHSNRNGAGRGFRLFYQEINTSDNKSTRSICPEVEPIAGGGTIRSHSRDNQIYSANQICSWNIPAQLNFVIILRFISFDLEGGNNCSYDNITVTYLKKDEQIQTSKIFCGSTIPEQLTSQNGLKIQFRTDKSIHKKGFVLEYKYARISAEDHCLNYQSLIHRNDTFGTIASVWNESFSINLSCEWLIGVSGHFLNITFDFIDVEESSLITYRINKCQFDNLTISYFDNLFNLVKYTICGREVPAPIVVPAPAYIRFKTSKPVKSAGFRIRYYKLNSYLGSSAYAENVQQVTTQNMNKGAVVFEALFIVSLLIVIAFLLFRQNGSRMKDYFFRVKERASSGIGFENLSYDRMHNQVTIIR